MNGAGEQTEALRQQMLLRALWRDAPAGALHGWLRGAPERIELGLQAHRAHAAALAERALRSACPTLAQMIGDDSFAGLAAAFWHAAPPLRGDIAAWGEALPAFVEAAPSLAEVPYLADVARIDWAVHVAASAADHAAAVHGLERLGDSEPDTLQLRLRPGTAVVRSAHPIVTIWQAHRSAEADPFAAAQAALAAQRAESALVWRDGHAVRVRRLDAAEAVLTSSLAAGQALGPALDAAGRPPWPPLDFEAWLIAALREGWLLAVDTVTPASPTVPARS